MNKLNLSPVLAATVAVTIYTHQDQAEAQGTVTYTNATAISVSGDGNHTVPFTPDILNADELLSISEGNINGSEAGTFTVAVQYADSSTQPIYNNTFFAFDGTQPGFLLNTIPAESFTTGDLTGLIFNLTGSGFNAANPKLTIPAGTVFTFQVTSVPEPASAALLVLGCAGIWATARRKTG